MIGSLSQLVRGAAILAIEDGTEKITRDLLDIVPVDYAADARTPPPREGRSRQRETGRELTYLPRAADPGRTGTTRDRCLLPRPARCPARLEGARVLGSGQHEYAGKQPARGRCRAAGRGDRPLG